MCSSSGNTQAKNTDLASQTASLDFQKQLMDIYTKQYGQQTDILNFLTKTLEPQISNPQGYSPEALAAMRTSATDTLSSQYDNASKALRNQQFLNGGENLPSGVNEMQTGALDVARASDTANTQNQITIANENLKNQNYWNAVNSLAGNAAQFNPNGTAANSTGAAGAVGASSNAVVNANQSQLLGALGGIAGGVGSALSGRLMGCWMAAAVFGEDFNTGVKTSLVRVWLARMWLRHWYVRPLIWLYVKTGQWLAKRRLAVKLAGPLFRWALRKAQEC